MASFAKISLFSIISSLSPPTTWQNHRMNMTCYEKYLKFLFSLFFCAKLSTESLDKKVFLFYYLVIVKHAYLILWSSTKLNFKVITNLFSTLLSHLLAHYVKLAQKSQTSFYSHVTCQSRASFSFLLALESLLRRSIEVCNKAKDLKKSHYSVHETPIRHT